MTDGSRHGGDGLRYTVALVEIWGGLNGLWGLLRDLGSTAFRVPLSLLPGILVIGLTLAASVVAGVALWHDRRWGYALSVPVQLAQAVWFVSADLTFRVAASGWLLADLFVRRSGENLVFGWQLDLIHKGAYALSLAPREEITVAFNLVALAILAWLAMRLRRNGLARRDDGSRTS